MSRALDSDVRASLSHERPAAAYEAISKALLEVQSLEEDQLLEIEFLGKSHALPPGESYLRDGNALAIPKQGLVQAFFAARSLFQEHNSREKAGSDKCLSPDALLAVSSVILLMDPEHLTAANARKRLIQSASANPERLLELVRRDKLYIDSLLTSRLHRHTKSPTLWSHRRWLVDTARQHGQEPDVAEGIKRIVVVAGERHPKNYYAWCHARWLIGVIPGYKRDVVMVEMVSVAKNFCLRNGGDISGWTFMSFLLARVDEDLRTQSFLGELSASAGFKFVNEARWVFLRTLAASGTVGQQETNSFQPNTLALLEKVQKPEDREVLTRAVSWFTTYRK